MQKIKKKTTQLAHIFDNNYISGAKLTKPQFLRHAYIARYSPFHRAENEECIKIPLVIFLLKKAEEIWRRKADANCGLWNGFGETGQGTQEGTWDSDFRRF